MPAWIDRALAGLIGLPTALLMVGIGSISFQMLPFDEQVMLDIEYIQEQSVKNDLKLLVKTVPAVISGRGAY